MDEFLNENNEVVNEVVEQVAEIASQPKSTTGFIKGFAIGGITVIGAQVAYKYVVKPIVKKVKAGRAAKKATVIQVINETPEQAVVVETEDNESEE